ncbi:MAG: arginine--tRNA ligase [Acidimicrobiales bacterium]
MSAVVEQLRGAVSKALEDLGLPAEDVRLTRPARLEHGDWATPVALALARRTGRPPRELATELRDRLAQDPPAHVEAVEVAGPGFVNFRLRPSWLHDVLVEAVVAGKEGFARQDLGRGERVQVEFVSANPTGPLHVGNGWLASYGDALARLLGRCGWAVEREYYVNDTGGQIRALGRSLLARRRGEAVPEGGYQGEYVSTLAALYQGQDRAAPGGEPLDEDVTAAGRWAAERILAHIEETLVSLGIVFDRWYSQASIEEGGALEETVAILSGKGLLYEAEGALMLRTTDFGDGRDRVLRKSEERGGDYTYLAGDIAYHRDKLVVRGFDRVIDVFGADHHGQVASLRAGVAALGVDPDRLEVRLGQMVSLVGEKMSKRSGNFVALDGLVAELGAGATRLLSLVSSIDQAATLDLDVVRSQSAENPVYYVQYAYARIAAINRVRAERGIAPVALGEADLSLLDHDRELSLLRCLAELESVIATAAAEREPHRVTAWVRDLAGRFHGFYHDCRVMGEGVAEPLTQARLWLVEGARIGLAIGLDLLGVEAPESMTRLVEAGEPGEAGAGASAG